MELILTESQFSYILREEKKNELESTFKTSRNFVSRILKDIKAQHGIDFSFALTWGPTIGGFVGPVSRYLEGTYPSLTHSDITLISFGIILTFFSSNTEKLNKVLKIVKERGLITFFDRGIMKVQDLKDAFFGFLESLNITFAKTSNMLAYTFLVPLIPMLKDISDMNLSSDQLNMIIKGILTYSGTSLSATIINEIIKKIIKRFKS